jgi:hypothetical protein
MTDGLEGRRSTALRVPTALTGTPPRTSYAGGLGHMSDLREQAAMAAILQDALDAA